MVINSKDIMETQITSDTANTLYSWTHPIYAKIYQVIYQQVKNKAVTDNLVEAVRRMNMFVLMEEQQKSTCYEQDTAIVLDQSFLLIRMAGLGTPSQYKKSIEKKFMCYKGTETKSVNNWYYLTVDGLKLIKPFLFLKEIDDGINDFPKFELRCTAEKLKEIMSI